MLQKGFALVILAVWLPHVDLLDNGLAKTPPMGWMSWAQFFCEIDCLHHPYSCISEDLYMDMATRLGTAVMTFFLLFDIELIKRFSERILQ